MLNQLCLYLEIQANKIGISCVRKRVGEWQWKCFQCGWMEAVKLRFPPPPLHWILRPLSSTQLNKGGALLRSIVVSSVRNFRLLCQDFQMILVHILPTIPFTFLATNIFGFENSLLQKVRKKSKRKPKLNLKFFEFTAKSRN